MRTPCPGDGDVFVAQVAMGANLTQVVKAMREAEAHPGPSLVIAYSPCIAHGIDMGDMLNHQKMAVQTGYWPLYRYDPRRELAGDHGVPDADGGTRVDLHLPQEELAAMLGATREAVGRHLKRFERDGLIALAYGRVVLRDPEGLRALLV